MEIDKEKFKETKERARKLFEKNNKVFCPYFNADIVLNSDGFHHLQFSARRERGKAEQLLKFNLLSLALNIIKKSGTVQEYRKTIQPFGKKKNDGFTLMKKVYFWAFIAIIGEERKIKIKTVVKKIGDGNIIFWSVMPYLKLKSGQKLYSDDIEDNI